MKKYLVISLMTRRLLPAFLTVLTLAPETWAAPDEPAQLAFSSAENLSWQAVPGARGYHLYRGSVASLPGGLYGTCLAGSLTATSGRDETRPPAGEAFFYLVSSFDENGESSAGQSSAGTSHPPELACIPARRLFGLAPNGTASDGVEDGVEPRRNPDVFVWDAAADLGRLNLATGEFSVAAEDLRLGGRGLDWSFQRTYRSQVAYDGPLGAGWDFSDNARVAREGTDIVYFDGTGRREVFRARGRSNHFEAPPGLYGKLVVNGDGTFTLRYRGKVKDLRDNGYGMQTIKSVMQQQVIAFPDPADDPRSDHGGCSLFDPEGLQPEGKKGPGRNYTFFEAWPCRWKAPELNRSLKGGSGAGGPNRGTPGRVRVFRGPDFLRVAGLDNGWDGKFEPPPLDGPSKEEIEAREKARNEKARAGAPHWFTSVSTGKNIRKNISVRLGAAGNAEVGPDGDEFLGGVMIEQIFAADGRLLAVQDQYGNRINYLYDHQNLLRQVVDSLGRTITYEYSPDGRITAVSLPDGLSMVFEYDGEELLPRRRLAAARRPGGADGSGPRTTSYSYTDLAGDPQLDGNLVSVTTGAQQGGGPPTIQVAYGSPATFAKDRAVQVAVGGTNSSGVPAGGLVSIDYAPLNPGADPALLDLPRRRATVTDRNGDVTVHDHRLAGHELAHVVQQMRLRSGADLVTQFQYNQDGEVTAILHPAGNLTLLTYDNPGADRFREGNLLEWRLSADPAASGGRGDGHGGEVADLVWTFSYEPVFNGLASLTSPPGNNPAFLPDNGGLWSAERFTHRWKFDFQECDPAASGILDLASRWGIPLGTTELNLGDLNNDGCPDVVSGLPVRWSAPEVLLDGSSRQAAIEGGTSQPAVTLFNYNGFGQLVRIADAEGNLHDMAYHPEAAPQGDGLPTPPPPDGRSLASLSGGMLASITRDASDNPGRNNQTNPPPAGIAHTFVWNARGLPAHLVDGRGVLTRVLYSAAGELVELRRAAATAGTPGPYGDPPTGRGDDALDPIDSVIRFSYDADGNLALAAISDAGNTRGLGPFIERSYAYDLLGNLVRETYPAAPGTALTWEYRYDGEGRLVRTIHPGGATDERVIDENGRVYSTTRGASGPGGGAPAAARYDYDALGNLVTVTDPEGGLTDYSYDGHNRLTKAVDEAGSVLERWHDEDDDQDTVPETEIFSGPVGGPAPQNRSGAGNVALAEVRYRKDERGRVFRVDRLLFMPTGSAPVRAPSLTEGPLVAGDSAVNEIYEYDRLSRPTFVHRDSGLLEAREWDGAGRVLRTWTGSSGGAFESVFTWDGGDNLVETTLTERSSTPGPAEELFFTTHQVDALGRRVATIDNLGGTRRFVFDSLDGLIAESDPRGPAGAATIGRKTPFHNHRTVSINGHGNVTRYFRDGLDRLKGMQTVLTASGEGDGTLDPVPDTSNPFNPDGLIETALEFSPRGWQAVQTDDRGNRTTFEHDNLGRLTRTTFDDGTQTITTYDRRNNPLTVTDPNGSVATFSYDLAGRKTRLDVARAPGVEGTTIQDFQYDGLGRITRARDNNDPAETIDDAVVRFFHDSLGRVVEEVHQTGGGAVRPVDYSWRADALLGGVTYPNGRNISYSYDSLDRLAGVLDNGTGRSAALSYFGLSRLHTRSFDSGVKTTMLDGFGSSSVGFDGLGRVTLLRHLGPGGTLLAGFESQYDARGNLRSMRRLHQPESAGFSGERFAYDSASRLVAAEEGVLDANHLPAGPVSDALMCTLDGEGNWPLLARNGVSYTATPNNLNEYDEDQSGGLRLDDGIPDDFHDQLGTPPDGWNLAYDRNGNQTNTGPVELRYDFLNRPVRALSGGASIGRYSYDALDRMIRRQVSGPVITTDRRYTPSTTLGRPVEERDASGTVVREEVFVSGRPLWMVRFGVETLHLLEDAGGSVAALADGAGNVLERVGYDPFGKPAFLDPANHPKLDSLGRFAPESDFGNTTLFRGLRYDPEFGLRTADLNSDHGGFFSTEGTYFNPNQNQTTSRRAGKTKPLRLTYEPNAKLSAEGPVRSPLLDDGGQVAQKQGGVACSCCLTCKPQTQLLGCNWLSDCTACCSHWQNRICGGGTGESLGELKTISN